VDNDLHRPDLVLAALERRHPFTRPLVLLARVEGDPAAPDVVAGAELWAAPPLDREDRRCRVEQTLADLGPEWDARPYRDRPLLVQVVVRPGPCWWSWDETEVLLGLRYGSNEACVRQGELYVVTAEGWYSPFSERWDVSPRACWAPALDPGAT
jgi:hypothetical protein